MSQKFPITLKFQQNGQISPTESMGVIDEAQLERICKIMLGEPEPEQAAKTPLPFLAVAFAELTQALTEAICVAEQSHDGNPTPGGDQVSACIQLSELRKYGSSPKQMALLLGCNTGYFPAEGEDPLVYFSASRFAPTAGFYDLLQEGKS